MGMGARMSRRGFLRAAGGVATAIPLGSIAESANEELRLGGRSAAGARDRIVDIHVHCDEKNPNFIRDFVAVAERINLTACLLTPYSHRVQVADAAKQHPRRIVPFGFIDLDATDVLSQVKDFHELGYRGLGELEFVKRPYVDASYLPVYELANEYGWVLLFHTGIVLRRSVDQPENVH
jgi:predicted TIM-barrel fold metal-dependent hydrolase